MSLIEEIGISSPIKVLFYWNVRVDLKMYLKSHLASKTNLSLIFLEELQGDIFENALKESQIIIGWRPKKEDLEKAGQLKIWINPGAGVQHLISVFRELNQERRVILINGHGNAYFTAQHTVGLLLAVLNKIVLHHLYMKEGKWRTGDTEGKSIPLRNKTIGLIGYGHVNRLVHNFLSGFDLSFNILKTSWPDKDVNLFRSGERTFTLDNFDEFLRQTNILVLAVPLTEKTKNLITSREITLLKDQAIIINVSRGPVINELDLYTALQNNQLCGAGLDVWYNYNPEENQGKKHPYTYPFHELTNVVLSPHRAASPMDDLARWDEVIENLEKISEGKGSLNNIVDLEKEY